MAPKKEAKAPPDPPSDWVARDRSKPHLLCVDENLTHTRCGNADIARGKSLLHNGLFRITYEITHASAPTCADIILGVCDAGAWQAGAGDAAAAEMIKAALGEGSEGKFVWARHSQLAAWGIEAKSGCLITTSDVTKGKYNGAQLGKLLVPEEQLVNPRCAIPVKSTVVLECDLLELDPQSVDILRHSFSYRLHPLELRGASEDNMPPSFAAVPRGRRTLRFSINGGEMVDAGVVLPQAVFPWVMLSWEGDSIALKAVEKFNPRS